MIKSLVLTGATSSLGTAIIDECINSNIKVLALVNPGSINIKRINLNENVIIKECALSEMKSLQIEGKYDAFIHLAWTSTAGDTARNQLQPQVLNIQYALDAVELAKKLECKVFIGSGSQAEYGRTEEVLTENTVTRPETAYGMAKLCAGQMTRLACKQMEIRHIWPRILSAYGPKCQPQSVLNYTLTELLNGRRPSLSGGEQIWDFIYTGDVARALLQLAEKGRDGEVYVIGSGCSKPLKEYLQAARQVVIKVTKKTVPELGLGDRPYGDNTVMHLACDVSKLINDTGFEPKTMFEDGVIRTIEWLDKYNEWDLYEKNKCNDTLL